MCLVKPCDTSQVAHCNQVVQDAVTFNLLIWHHINNSIHPSCLAIVHSRIANPTKGVFWSMHSVNLITCVWLDTGFCFVWLFISYPLFPQIPPTKPICKESVVTKDVVRDTHYFCIYFLSNVWVKLLVEVKSKLSSKAGEFTFESVFIFLGYTKKGYKCNNKPLHETFRKRNSTCEIEALFTCIARFTPETNASAKTIGYLWKENTYSFCWAVCCISDETRQTMVLS